MAAGKRSPQFLEWREIASLGEQLVSANSLAAQRDRIVSITGRLIHGKAEVWLHEAMFRLPDWDAARLFPPQPRQEGMRRALARQKLYLKNAPRRAQTKRAVVAIPIEDQGFLLGVLQVARGRGPDFTPDEIELLRGLTSVVAVGLYASHRVEVERFRIGQLNLVRDVSAQIASVLNIDELASRVTELIQKTFQYYYVAIFTLRPGTTSLRFRSSAGAPRKGQRKPALTLDVDIGQGLIGEVAATGRRILASDVRKDDRYRFIGGLPETRSEVVIPLKIEDRVLGVLDVQSDHLNAFHPNDLLLLEALADNIARAVESARLYGDVRRRAEQLALVSEVSRSVTSTLDLDEIMDEAAALIHEGFGYPYVHLFSVHKTRGLIEYEAGSGKRSRALEGYAIRLDDPEGIIPFVAREGHTVLSNNVSQEPRYRPSPLPPRNTRSELCVPLSFGDKVLGVLDIQSDRLNAFNDEDRVTFEAVAGTIAAAIRNADLYRSEQWRRQVADSFREVAGLLSANAGVDEVLESVLTELERNLPVDVSAIWLAADGDLVLAAVHGGDAQAIEHARLSDPEASRALTSAMLAEEPVIRRASEPPGPTGLASGFDRQYSSLAAPLRLGGQTMGVITLAHRTAGRYGHEAQAMVTTFAGYAAVAIENARLYDAAQEQAYASAALLQVAQAVVSLNDLDEILGTILRSIPILVGVDRAALYLWNPDRLTFRLAHAYGLEDRQQAILAGKEIAAGSFPMLEATRASNCLLVQPTASGDGPDEWQCLGEPWLREDAEILRSQKQLLITVPLSVKSDVFGVILLQEAPGGRRFRERRLEIITGIAQQAAMAIQNDLLQQEMVVRERFETEIQLARQIQKTFLPETLPLHPEWELAARWKTAREVGGDFYDVMELPDHRLGLFIADVADKGVPAALFMALTRTLVRAAVTEIRSPAEALARVNELLIPDTRQGMFVTAVYAVLDQVSGELIYANAGHNPPLVVSPDRKVEKLTRTGIALGATEVRTMTERSLVISPGSSVLFYTDGLTEAFSSDGEMYGENRLIAAIQASPPVSAEGLLDSVEAHLNEFAGPVPAADDLTMLVVRRK